MFKRTFLFLLLFSSQLHIADAFWNETNAQKAFEQLEKIILQINNPKAKEVFKSRTFMENSHKSAGDLIPIPNLITEETTEAELNQKDHTNKKIFNSSEECKNQIKNAVEKIKTCTDCIPESRLILCLVVFRDLIESN